MRTCDCAGRIARGWLQHLHVPIALLLVLILIYRCFDSVQNMAVIALNIPLAIVGGGLLLGFGGMPLSVPALVGYIAVFGIAVQNAMVMVHYFNTLRENGAELKQAVLEGAKVRFRPELLSAAVGSLALVPLLFSTGIGAEIEKPLAAVVIGGLASRPLSIVVLPVFYHWIEQGKAAVGGG